MLLQIGKPHKAKRKGKCGVYSYYFCRLHCSHRRTGMCRYLTSWTGLGDRPEGCYRGPEDDKLIAVYAHVFNKS